jgi:hypothetical protein
MAEEDKFHVGKPPVSDGNNYDYWKKRMEVHFKALGRELWRIVMEGMLFWILRISRIKMIKMKNSMIEP